MATDRVGLKPVIDEIVRTEVCPDVVTLLVDHVSVIKATRTTPRGGDQAFRLWLSDGMKSIQAIIKYELHPYLVAGHICEGSYIELTRYNLAAAKRLHGEGFVYILQIADFHVVDHDGRRRQPLRFENIELASELPFGEENEQRHVETVRRSTTSGQDLSLAKSDNDQQTTRPDSLESSSQQVGQSKKDDCDTTTLPESDPNPDEISLVATRHCRRSLRSKDPRRESKIMEADNLLENVREKRKRELTSSPLEDRSDNNATRPVKAPKASCTSLAQDARVPLKEITRPLKITPLAKITGPRTVRNQIHDVLAVVCSVDDQVVNRRGYPIQRNIRITDPSTTKQVQLTVFVDAAIFHPAVGTVALFRNVTTHEWNGGSLKAYPRDCAGARWFFPQPGSTEGVDHKRVSLLEHCWESRKVVQRDANRNELKLKLPK